MCTREFLSLPDYLLLFHASEHVTYHISPPSSSSRGKLQRQNFVSAAKGHVQGRVVIILCVSRSSRIRFLAVIYRC